jgi:esterase
VTLPFVPAWAAFGEGARRVYVVHGVLGAGRNWRSFCRGLSQRMPGWTIVAIDIRHHGDSGVAPPPNTLAAAAADLRRLEAKLGAADCIVGHSLGGKIATLAAREGRAVPLVVIDAPLGLSDVAEATTVLQALASATIPAPNRATVRDHLVALGLSQAVAAWLLTSLRKRDDGWHWVWSLSAVGELLHDYARLDLWDLVELPCPTLVVRAGGSDRWRVDDLARFQALGSCGFVIEGSGHWVHVDAPGALADRLAAFLGVLEADDAC